MRQRTQEKLIQHLGRRDGLVLGAIFRMHDPTNEEIARATGYCPRSVQLAIASLVRQGYLIRVVFGPYRRLRPGIRFLSERRFSIPQEDYDYLVGKYGQERVDEAIHVLEYTYALSKTEPRCPMAILKAVLKRGNLRYPKGYLPPDRVAGYPRHEVKRAEEEFRALPREERQAYLARAYTLSFARFRDHARALGRARAGALLLFLRDRASPGPGSPMSEKSG